MKVLYHIGDGIGLETRMHKGIINTDIKPYILEGNDRIIFNDIRSAELIRLNGIGIVIRVQNRHNIIYLTVPRLYFEIGTGFVIINLMATKKLKHLLEIR